MEKNDCITEVIVYNALPTPCNHPQPPYDRAPPPLFHTPSVSFVCGDENDGDHTYVNRYHLHLSILLVTNRRKILICSSVIITAKFHQKKQMHKKNNVYKKITRNKWNKRLYCVQVLYVQLCNILMHSIQVYNTRIKPKIVRKLRKSVDMGSCPTTDGSRLPVPSTSRHHPLLPPYTHTPQL